MPKLNPVAKPLIRATYQQLNNRPIEIMHNHDHTARIVYAGFSQKLPDHHLFRCESFSTPPRKLVLLDPFDRTCFISSSKAGRGGCSMRKCPEDAEQMDIGRHKAYCRRCSQRVTGIIPCSGTSVELCPHKWGLDKGYRGTRCPTCAAFEVETTP